MQRRSPYGLSHDLFVVDFREQTEWKWLIATAFFLGELGAGVFLVSMLVGYAPGMLLGLLLVLVGKNSAHLLYLGRPERFWRAVSHPATSWISRGFVAMIVLAVSGALVLLFSLGWLPIAGDG